MFDHSSMADTDTEGALHPLLSGLGDRVRSRRTELGISQRRLADTAGTDAARISRLERGLRVGNLTINVVAGIAHGLQCRFGWLATGEMPVEPLPKDAPAGLFISPGGLSAQQARQLRDIAAAIELLNTPDAKPGAPKHNKTRR